MSDIWLKYHDEFKKLRPSHQDAVRYTEQGPELKTITTVCVDKDELLYWFKRAIEDALNYSESTSKPLVQQSPLGGVDIAKDDNVVHLSDDDIARIIQVRFCFERMTWEDLVLALTLWQKTSGIKQISLEEVMRNDR